MRKRSSRSPPVWLQQCNRDTWKLGPRVLLRPKSELLHSQRQQPSDNTHPIYLQRLDRDRRVLSSKPQPAPAARDQEPLPRALLRVAPEVALARADRWRRVWRRHAPSVATPDLVSCSVSAASVFGRWQERSSRETQLTIAKGSHREFAPRRRTCSSEAAGGTLQLYLLADR